jgi:type II secretory ATPase GspE/PulE/Tfp pilus assembly ATPase PilB-like protein/CheY-like chemotaxis protein
MSTEEQSHLSGMEGAARPTASFGEFVAWLKDHLPEDANPEALDGITPLDLFMWGLTAGLSEEDLTERLSDFCGIPTVSEIDEDDVEFNTLPRPFCEAKLVLPVKSVGKRQNLILANPFDWVLFEDLERTVSRGKALGILLASPTAIRRVLFGEELGVGEGSDQAAFGTAPSEGAASSRKKKDTVYDPEKDPGRGHPVAKLAVAFLGRAVAEKATELVVEPRGSGAVARAVMGGEVHDLQEMPAETGKMLVSRFKALAGMDVAKKRTPQTGRMEVKLEEKVFRLRLSTSPSKQFENLTIRVLDPSSEPLAIPELGLSQDQGATLQEMANQDQGLILFVGSPGSGKTTTVCSVLKATLTEDRSLLSVEDTIEYLIPFGLQHEVEEEAGSTFDSLLQNAIREEPDILFVGHLDDVVSARACAEFATAGHLVLTTMASSNATTALFRLERLGLTRFGIADGVIGVVAQRLLKRLCTECKWVRPISPEESALLEPFTDNPPTEVANPVGCSYCKGTGYRGQEGVFEVLGVGPRMAAMIRDDKPISEIRDFSRERGDLLVSDHGIEKIRELVLPVQDVYREVLLEERGALLEEMEGEEDADAIPLAGEWPEAAAGPVPTVLMDQDSILVVDDDEDTRDLLDRILSRAGYRVIQASDGGEALLKLGCESMDLILSDIHMPSLDGLKLLEIANQHGLHVPIILLTAEPSQEAEARGREMGAADYLRKPIKKDLLLESIRDALDEALE